MKKSLLSFYNLRNKDKQERYNNWNVAFGLQGVDLISGSSKLIELAKKNIKGQLDLEDIENEIIDFYGTIQSNSLTIKNKDADLLTIKAVELLSNDYFEFKPNMLIYIHDYLFNGMFYDSDRFRNCDIKYKEWILNNETIKYEDYQNIPVRLEALFDAYKEIINASDYDNINNISYFLSQLWYAHPFCEGNTKTIIIFINKYFKVLGIDVNSKVFKDNSFYLRNALIRDNYSGNPSNEYLIKFLENALIKKDNELKNRDMKLEKKERIRKYI